MQQELLIWLTIYVICIWAKNQILHEQLFPGKQKSTKKKVTVHIFLGLNIHLPY